MKNHSTVPPDGFLQLTPEDTIEYKKTHLHELIDTVEFFPFIYFRVSNMERIFLKIKKNEHIVMKNGVKTLVRNRKKSVKTI